MYLGRDAPVDVASGAWFLSLEVSDKKEPDNPRRQKSNQVSTVADVTHRRSGTIRQSEISGATV